MSRPCPLHCAPLALLLAALLAVTAPVCAQHRAEQGAPGAPLRVVRVTPGGDDVAAGRQIVFQFNRAVVALGRMARAAHEIPVRIQPRLDCQWRWLDTSALACQLQPHAQLALGTRYRVSMDPGIRAEDGATLDDTLEHTFTTQRPAVGWVSFRTWLAPDMPVVQVTFNQPVTRSSVREHLFYEARGEGSARIPVRVAATHADGLAALAGTATPAQLASAALRASSPSRAWLIAPVEGLPLDASVALNTEPGVRGSGPEGGVETRAVTSFDVFPQFRFVGVRCTHVITGESLELPLARSAEGPGLCDPLARAALEFSAPVAMNAVRTAVTLTPDLAGGRSDYDPWEDASDWLDLGRPHARGTSYAVWFPEYLKAFQHYHVSSVPGALRDAFGRALEPGIEMDFGTAHRQPRLVLTHPYAVLEQGVDSEVPLYVTNLDAVELSYRRLGAMGTRTRRLAVPAVEDISFALPMRVRDLLDGDSGVVSGRMNQVPPRERGRHIEFFAQVTPFAILVKLGHFGSMVWVTRMDDGEPVAGAAVTLYQDRYDVLQGPGAGATGPFITNASGIARLPGSAVLDPTLDLLRNWRRGDPRLFVKVDKDGELGVLPLDGEFRVWTRDVWANQNRAYGHLRAWGTTAQGIYRAGDTIQYKLYVRDQDTHTLVPAPREGYTLSVVDPKGEPLLDKLAVTLNAFGAFDGELPVPANAAVGWYRFRLHSRHSGQSLDAFRVLVSDFTPAPFKVRTDLNGDAFAAGDTLGVTASAALHAGGPYTGAKARFTVRVAARTLTPEHPLARTFRFQTQTRSGWQVLYQDEQPLDARGERTLSLPLFDAGIEYGTLQVESAVSDDRGKRVAAAASASFAARDRFVGLRNTRWLHTRGKLAQVDYLVVDAAGAPVAGVPVSIAVERMEVFAARVKGAGNAYQTRYEQRWESVSGCSGRSSAQGSACMFVPPQPGRYRLTARIADSLGRAQQSTLQTWVQGSGRVTWREPEDGALALMPEKARYQVGDTARFMVRNPFPGALALVTVERYGVLRSWTERLDGSTPVIAFPVLADDLPGFYLSVNLVSPRVAAPPPARGQVDLGKPATRVGYVRVPVDDPVKRLDVAVNPAQAVYRPRETARIDLAVTAHDDGAVADAPVEIAVAVLDEAVFDLIAGGRRNFDPYTGFYDRFSLDVVGYSLLTRLVGRQKFESKGASSGGDGGQSPGLRDLFRFVSYWNPSLPVDDTGHASIEVALPDNLTGWRVLALAVTPGDRLGLGEGGFKVNKDTELRPVMPNQVTAGDRFQAGFTVLNRSDEARTLEVRLSATGDALAAPANTTRSVTVAPFARASVWLDLATRKAGEIRIVAEAGDERDRDALEHNVRASARSAITTAATYGSLNGDSATVSLAVPGNIVPDVGSISLVTAPTVIGNVDGAFHHMRAYPYACWEQRLSKGLMAAQHGQLQGYLDPANTWPGAAELAQQTLIDSARFQAPGGGMSFWVASDERVSPYLSAYTAIGLDWLERAGYTPPGKVTERLHGYLRRMLRKNVLPDFYDRGMASSVRAVALAALARRGAIEADDVLRHREHLPHMSVFAKAHYLEAAWRRLGKHPATTEALDSLLAHAQESGGKIAFNEAANAGGGHLLDTPARANCAALDTLSALSEDAGFATTIEPLLGKLTRSITAARGRRDHWANTQENVFCMSALAGYAKRFEVDTPHVTVRAAVDSEPLGEARFTAHRDPAVTLSRPLLAGDAGARRVLTMEHDGSGRVYYSARLRFALDEDAAERVTAGMSLRREYSVQRDGAWQLLTSPMQVRTGELLRVDLFLSLPTARHFVVVDDPVPGGLEPVNRDLATTSQIDAEQGTYSAAGASIFHTRDDWRGYNAGYWSFYHKELRHHAARFFSDYLPAGDYHLSYSAQVIAPGEFAVQPAHAEEMYDPDVFANGLPATLRVTGGERP